MGVRIACIPGVADVGVGYAALLANALVLSCGVEVGVEFGNGGPEEFALGMPKPCNDALPGIGVGVE